MRPIENMSEIPDKKRIEELSKEWLDGTLTAAGQEEYDRWYDSIQDHEVHDLSETDLNNIQDKIYQAIAAREHLGDKTSRVKRIRLLKRLPLIAASVCLFYVAALQIYTLGSKVTNEEQEVLYAAITPGRDRATLSLANGLVFDLDSLGQGEIFQEDGISIEKNEKGDLVYSILGELDDRTTVLVNTVSTPKGGQYKILLADGSEVWLNAESKITFPIAFAGESREVNLEGEAYFEVAQHKGKPFSVVTSKEEVEVLGTHFNVSAYGDDEFSTVALLEGGVKVSLPSSTAFKFLNPGEQSIVREDLVEVRPVDLTEAVAWKMASLCFIMNVCSM